ncbi:uncharacterized protein LOC108821511 [Raphanus sativus]|uniref:Uncharacterized protein LOC108821511 n=1 Tax=Raphanus sativus TaxID=3726 RepID=A0A6J0KQ43_RAPSA|nr:uncharacterized protein LOC108821511 [Raphanus sativus]
MERASSSSSEASSSMASSSSDQTSHFVTSSMLSRTSSTSSSAFGDYIGTESCFDILSADEENDVLSVPTKPSNRYRYGGRRREEREARAAAAREFPPPIPLLAQTENLLPHMPWVLKRVVTSDGRLILREEKVRHHEYFRAHRANGRLTLHLVPLDDDVFDLPQEPSHYQSDDDDYDHDDEEHECDDDYVDDEHHHEMGEDDTDDLADSVDNSIVIKASDEDDVDHGVIHNYEDDKCNVHGGSEDAFRKAILAAAAAEETVVESGGMVGGGGSPRGKCMKSCFVGMTVREIRPVLS